MTSAAQRPEERESLWTLALAPAIWVAHFMLSYVTAAIWCAKFVGPDASLVRVRIAMAIYTVAALLGISVTAWRGFQRHSFEGSAQPHDFDSAGDRHRFLGFATLLLSGLSAVATVYVALAAVFVRTCH